MNWPAAAANRLLDERGYMVVLWRPGGATPPPVPGRALEDRSIPVRSAAATGRLDGPFFCLAETDHADFARQNHLIGVTEAWPHRDGWRYFRLTAE